MVKKILLLGANGKIGSVIAQKLIADGHSILLQDLVHSPTHYIDEDDKISKIEYLVGDITDGLYIERIIENYDFDAVINCAYLRGKSYGSSFELLTIEQFNENVGLSLGTNFALMQKAFCKSVRDKTEINFINFSSIYGTLAPLFEIYDGTDITMPIEYAAIKSALISLTRYFAKAARGTQFRVNCISPGGIYDGQDKIFREKYNYHCNTKGLLDAQDLNGLISFLVSDGSQYINGQNFVIDDGFSL